MGSMYGSCGHDITDEWDADPRSVDLSIMDFTRECENAVSYGCYCKDCRNRYEKMGVVLHNEQEEEKWLRGELEYPE
jgi:hypothetical protein